jgi:hypothetical protein
MPTPLHYNVTKAMTGDDDLGALREAIKARKDKEARAAVAAQEHKREREQKEQRQAREFGAWSSHVRGIISAAVRGASDDAARSNSAFILSPSPDDNPNNVVYRAHPSGQRTIGQKWARSAALNLLTFLNRPLSSQAPAERRRKVIIMYSAAALLTKHGQAPCVTQGISHGKLASA